MNTSLLRITEEMHDEFKRLDRNVEMLRDAAYIIGTVAIILLII